MLTGRTSELRTNRDQIGSGMIDPKLNHICRLIDAWCEEHHITYDIVCDETDLQGIMIFKKNSSTLENLIRSIYPHILEGNIFLQTKTVRNGVVMALSLNAITEDKIEVMIKESGHREGTMAFRDKINDAFGKAYDIGHREVKLETPNDSYIDFGAAAQNIVKEAQRKPPLIAKSGSLRSSINDMSGQPGQSKKKPKMGATKGSVKGISDDTQPFETFLSEALDGLATADGRQPSELFKLFARSLRVLGQKLGVGPLQDRLTQQGISWKQSDDGQSIILSVKNAATGLDQPISSINYETLQNPADFEDQLKNMMDLATGQAPGSFAQKEQEVQDQKKTIGDIARAIKPQDEQGEVAQLMNADAEEMSAGQAAATQAALPKESLERRIDEAFNIDQQLGQIDKAMGLLKEPQGTISAINAAAYRGLLAKKKALLAQKGSTNMQQQSASVSNSATLSQDDRAREVYNDAPSTGKMRLLGYGQRGGPDSAPLNYDRLSEQQKATVKRNLLFKTA